jgi:tetratricopeptide (TPR) repeat protein
MQSRLRTLGPWAVFGILLGVFCGFLGRGESGTKALPLVVCGPVLVVSLFYLRRFRQGAQLNMEAALLMSRGHFVAALEKLETARPLLKGAVGVVPTNVGDCRLELWQLKEAEREFLSVRAHKKLHPHVRRILPARLALVAAIRGQVGEARERLEESRAANPEGDPVAVLAEAVLACRRGEWAEARGLLEQPMTRVLGGSLRGLRDALLAWSVERITGERRYVDAVTLFGEASSDTLREAWPELMAFLVDRARQVA